MTDPFLDHRRRQEAAHAARADARDPMASLVSVELNVMDACNRACVFCPHADPERYPNRYEKRMPLAVTRALAGDLAFIGYAGRISFSGYGEPLLNKDVFEHIAIVRAALPEATIEMNTNTDPLSAGMLERLDTAGLDYLYCNLYDGPERQGEIAEMVAKVGPFRQMHIVYRAHWRAHNDYGLELNNRSGLVGEALAEPVMRPCAYPAYKAFVDWNGDVQGCTNDWGREMTFGNVMETHIRDIWLSEKMERLRKRVFYGDRSESPCDKCSVQGTLHGTFSRDLLIEHYGWPKAAAEGPDDGDTGTAGAGAEPANVGRRQSR